uniref:Calmodulin n=1 Tax=Leptocylindrus aporus TaxID=1398097 RepID=A0A7S0PJL1_9STRA|mmetsp:Transcript_1289/g.1732  ORF Transcript_1289/g.1732 Transcript_1289/m.1732 type:complete len:116 (+) Transcript_1289:116-463(+)
MNPTTIRPTFILRQTTGILRKTMFSTQPPAADRLRCIFEEYRQQNYSQELPSRFRKEMVQAMLRRSQRHDSRIHLEEVRRVLANIGASEKISQEELHEIFHGDDGVDVKQMIMYL